MAEKKLMVVVGANITDFQKKMNETTKTLTRMSRDAQKSFGPIMNTIGTGLKVAGVAAATGFGAVVAAGIKMNAELEQSKVAFTTMLGSAQQADQFLRQMRNFAARTPFEFNELQGAAKKMLAFGFAAQDVIPMMTAVGDAVAGLGGGQEMIDRVTMAMGQMKAKGKVSAEELMQLAEAGIPAYEILQKKLGLSADQIANIGKEGINADKAIKALLAGMEEKFGGMMIKQSKTWGGLFSTLKDNVAIFMQEITGPIFEMAKTRLAALMDYLAKLEQNGTLKQWANKIAENVKAMWNVANNALNGLIQAGKFIYNNWSVVGPALAGVVAGFMAFKAAITVVEILNATTKMLNGTLSLNPIGMVTLAAMGLVTAGVLLYKNWDTIKEKATELWNGIKTTFAKIKTTISELWSEAVQWGENVVKGIAQGFVNMTSWIKEQVLGFCKNIGQTVKQFFGIASPSKLMAEYGKYVVEGFANGIKDGTKSASERASAMASSIKSALDTVLNSTSLTVGIAQAEFDKLKTKLSENGNQATLYQAQVNMLTTQINSQTNAIAVIQKAYSDMAALIGRNSVEAQELYLKLVQEQNAYLGLKNQMNELKGTQDLVALGFKNVTDSIDASLVSLAKWVSMGSDSAAVARLLSSKNKNDVYEGALIKGLTDQMTGGKSWRDLKVINGVPQFDKGGTVAGPIGSRQLIMAHGGETVLPTHKTGSLSRSVTVGPIYIYDARDPEKIAKEVKGIFRQLAVEGAY